MDNDGIIRKEPLTLYRGFAAIKYKEFPFLRNTEDIVEYVFNEPYPGLCSPVALRYNSNEAYKRYHEMCMNGGGQAVRTTLLEHYKNEREFSYLVSATESEEHAIFFAGSSWKDNPFGLVVRFKRDHDYEVFSPTNNLHPYREVIVAGMIEPREIDKVLLVGCRAPNHMLVEFVYKRTEDGRVRKFRNPDHLQYTYMRNVLWTPESFFTPSLESLRPKQ